MKYTTARLQRDVMALLGETPRSHDRSDAVDVPWPEDVVAAKSVALMAEAATELIKEAPQELLGGGCGLAVGNTSMRPMPCGLYAAEVKLPGGFLRFVSARMSEWSRSVSRAEGVTSAQWGRQWSAESGIAGSPEMPRAYLDSDGACHLLRLVGCRSAEATLVHAAGWCVPVPDDGGEFEFPEGLYPVLIGEIASRLCR